MIDRSNRLNRFIRLFVTTAILSTLLAFAAAAPVAAAEPYGTCSNVLGTNIHNGIDKEPGQNFGWVRGVRAVIYHKGLVFRCTGADVNNGALYYISVTPAPGTTKYSNDDAIFQIGVIQCYDSLYPGNICDDGGENSTHIFWARGGCAGHTPIIEELATPANSGGIEFKVWRSSGGTWNVGAWDWDTGALITQNLVNQDDEEVQCWIHDTVEADYTCERWDGNDGCGDDGDKVHFSGIRFRRETGGYWYYWGEDGYGQSLSDADCEEETSEDFCDTTAPTNLYLWNQQGY